MAHSNMCFFGRVETNVLIPNAINFEIVLAVCDGKDFSNMSHYVSWSSRYHDIPLEDDLEYQTAFGLSKCDY